MSAALAWLAANPLVRRLLVYGAIVLAVLLLLLGLRKQGEEIGKTKIRLENANAIAKARRDMDAVPRPGGDDVARRLRRHRF